MASLKDLRGRINSVKSTRKITSAMKMVAAAKLRRAQAQAEAARPYAQRMEAMLASLGAAVAASPTAPRMLVGTGSDQVHLLVAVTADRGLAGAVQYQRRPRWRGPGRALEAEGKQVKLLTVGRKGRDFLRREFASRFVGEVELCQQEAGRVRRCPGGRRRRSRAMLDDGRVRRLHAGLQPLPTVITQIATEQQLIPAPIAGGRRAAEPGGARRSTSIEPDEETSSPRCCRATSRSRSIRRCWKAPPASMARG